MALGRATKLLVEVDVLGVDEEALRTDAVKPKGKTVAVACREYPAGAGSALRKATGGAAVDEQTDSEVQFAVLSVDAKGEEKEPGVAAVSLEALLEKGADHAEAAVPAGQRRQGRRGGPVTVAVTALAAMKEIDAEVGGEPAGCRRGGAATPPVAVATPTPTATATPPVAVAVATAAPAAAELPVAVATAPATATATEEAPALKPAMSRCPGRRAVARTGGAHRRRRARRAHAHRGRGGRAHAGRVALEKKSKLVVTASARPRRARVGGRRRRSPRSLAPPKTAAARLRSRPPAPARGASWRRRRGGAAHARRGRLLHRARRVERRQER